VLQKRLAEVGLIKFSTSFRVKGRFSLYHKLKRKEWNIDSIYDLMAMRLVVDSVEDCYRALGIVHELWRPLPQRVKDYIAFPKPNGYQSLHTTATTPNGIILEVQIRTEQMHQEAEYGVASHILYKNTQEDGDSNLNQTTGFASLLPNLFRPFSRNQAPPVAELDKTIDLPHEHKIPGWISQIGQTYKLEDHSTSQFIEDAEKPLHSVARSMERSWQYLNTLHPWGCFLSEGAFKKVYKVYNARVGVDEALSVMYVNKGSFWLNVFRSLSNLFSLIIATGTWI
jgi:hypothetical protein